MKSTPVRLGPLALLMTVVSICLTILSILTLTTAGADLRLAEKYADSTKTKYALEAQGQEFLRDTDDALADGRDPASLDGVKRSSNGYTREIKKDGYTLTVSFTAEGGSYEITDWKLTKEWEENTDINVWSGN